MFIDSHCHLNLLDLVNLGTDLTGILEQAKSNKVTHVLSVATQLEQHLELLAIAQKFPMVKISVGVHPEHSHCHPGEGELFDNLISLGKAPEVLGIGETGLDYYHFNYTDIADLNLHKKLQQTALIQHIHAAIKLNKPLIIHSRAAPKDTISILSKEARGKVIGVMHCFTESWELAKQSLDLGFYISFSGIITFKNNVNELLEIVKKVPLDRILIETDSPYLSPVPFRGKQNQPGYVHLVAAKIAEIKQIALEKIALITSKNYEKLFNYNLLSKSDTAIL